MNELILEIMKIALEKNHINKNTIFVNFYGHVNSIRIGVYKNGWKKDTKPTYTKEAHLKGVFSDEYNKQEVKEILNYLKGLED